MVHPEQLDSRGAVQPARPDSRHGGATAAVDLYWLPLGAGGVVVQLNGRVYEAFRAAVERRSPCALYHCALEVRLSDGRYAVELTPVPDRDGAARGVVAEGPVGSRWLGRFRLFRYELRCWRDGVIPDLGYAVARQRLTSDPRLARRLLDVMASVPTPVWGRDELRAGEMWNSNSVVSWLLARSGLPVWRATPPSGGRAPGWNAGLVVAGRQHPRDRPDATSPAALPA